MNSMKTKALHEFHSMKWENISRFRGELMGFAMLIILLFHVCGPHNETLFLRLCRCGNVGVDMFMFVSGVGLWFAWSKGTTLGTFYLRRFKRVYPAWFVVACLFFVPIYIKGGKTLADTILDIAVNWSFWTVYGELQFWYVPAIMLFYVFAPGYMSLVGRSRSWCWLPVVAMLFCILMYYDKSLYASLRHLEIMFSRIPIFLIGINVGSWVKEKRVDDAHAWGVAVLAFVLSAWVCLDFEGGLRGRFPLFLERMAYIPLTLSFTLMLSHAFAAMPKLLLRLLAFVGTISLEFYIIHYEFVLKQIRPLQLGFWPTVLLTFAVTVPFAWLLQKLLNKIFK